MRLHISIAVLSASLVALTPALTAQQKPSDNSSQSPQNPPAHPQQPAGSGGNPFPEDTTSVPVLPNASTSSQPDQPVSESSGRVTLPAGDTDPARSPDESGSASPSQPGDESTSSVPGIDRIQPRDDEDTKRKGRKSDEPEFHETAANDIDVGKYYLERKDWKAAQSRFQSAMILDPENPDVFWGLAESARHLGDFAGARSYYTKVVDYDPDSRHGKDAKKALKDPEIANAQSTASSPAKK